MPLENKKILIVGASSGLGKALIEKLEHYNVKIMGTFNTHQIDNNLIDCYQCDISKESEVELLFTKLKEKYQTLDIVINCASLSLDDDIYDKSLDDFMTVLGVNLGGTFLISKYASLILDKGIIINISSTDGINTFSPLSLDYSASKAGVINLTQNLALRFSKIKFLTLAPNWIDTDSVLNANPEYIKTELKRIKQKKLLKKEDVAQKIISMMIDENIISGTVIVMDGKNE